MTANNAVEATGYRRLTADVGRRRICNPKTGCTPLTVGRGLRT
jgi:hypothetical protein